MRTTWSRVQIARTIAVAVSACIVASSAACKKKGAAIVTKKLALPDSAEQIVFGMSVVVSDNGVSKGHLLSDTAYVYPDMNGKRLELRRVHFTFKTPQGSDDGTMTALAGSFNDRLSRLEGRGNVIVDRKDGSRLESPQLVYDNARNSIFTDSSFVLTLPDKRITGVGFESDPKLTSYKCHRNCKPTARIKVPAE